jgi:hypothetical protein
MHQVLHFILEVHDAALFQLPVGESIEVGGRATTVTEAAF